MKLIRSLFVVAVAAALSASLIAQQAPTGYHNVACIKVKPEKTAEFRKFFEDDVRKVQQARADSGAISTWILVRSIAPQGASAECDYLSISTYPGVPPKPLSLDELGAVIKRAGLTMSAQEYVDRRTSLTELVSNNLFQNRIFVGTMKKGDYLMANYMKVANIDDWLAYEKKVWQPIAESMVQAGHSSGWSVNVQVLPGGADLPFDAVTVDVYPSWDALFAVESHYNEHFKKTHPDMEMGTTMEQFQKLRTILSSELMVIDDMVTAAK
ncbi:MAG: hypothetical protein ACLPY1_17615 [Terracidiphilus sp.]